MLKVLETEANILYDLKCKELVKLGLCHLSWVSEFKGVMLTDK